MVKCRTGFCSVWENTARFLPSRLVYPYPYPQLGDFARGCWNRGERSITTRVPTTPKTIRTNLAAGYTSTTNKQERWSPIYIETLPSFECPPITLSNGMENLFFSSGLLTKRRERGDVGCWSLFSRLPGKVPRYTVSVGGVVFNTPALLLMIGK